MNKADIVRLSAEFREALVLNDLVIDITSGQFNDRGYSSIRFTSAKEQTGIRLLKLMLKLILGIYP